MMSTIIRLKRKKENEPKDALFIRCKRSKTENDDIECNKESITAVKYSATVNKQEDNVKEHLPEKLTKKELEDQYKTHIVKFLEKSKKSLQINRKESRLKVVNSKRGIDNVHIIDIEDEENPIDGNSQYVYDIYCCAADEELALDNLIEVIEPTGQELVFEECFKNDSDNDSEDSNSESNWRNDYPDSDHSENSITEDHMLKAMKNMNLEDDLSSDDDFVYGLDEADVTNYGHKYAKWKAKIKKGNYDVDDENESSNHDEDDDDDDGNLEDDSDEKYDD